MNRHLSVAVLLVNLTVGAGALPVAGGESRALAQLVIVFKTHFDIGYTDMASNVVHRYRTTMIDDALRVVEQNRDLPLEQQFAWTIPGWPMHKITEEWPGQSADRQEKIHAALAEGRFVVHALPFTTHTETLEIEDLVRGLGYASRVSRAVGLELPRDAKMTDVPCHAWILPTLLRHAGVDFLHLGCNAASSSPEVPPLFWWEGPDGSRLLTMYTAESYGTGLVPPADWPHKTWLALIHTGDNHGPPRPEEVTQLLAEAGQKLPGVHVKIGRLSDFADAILAELAADATPADRSASPDAHCAIPVVRGDMPDTWIHGPMSNPQGARLARTVRPAIATTESLHTLLGAWGVSVPSNSDALATAREQSLLYGEHTWGGAQYWVTQYGAGTQWSYGEGWAADRARGRFERLEASWAEHTAYIEAAAQQIQPVLRRHMQTLAEAVSCDGERIVVFNPLPWERRWGLATADAGDTRFRTALLGTGSDSFVRPVGDGTVGNAVLEDRLLRVEAYDVPAMGYQTLVAASGQTGDRPPVVLADAATVRARELEAILDPARGTVGSLHGEGQPELVDTASPWEFGQILYERFDASNVAAYVHSYVKLNVDWAVNELGKPAMPPADQVPYRAASPTNFSASYTSSGLAGEAILHAPATDEVPFAVTTRYIFYNVLPFFDIEVTIHDKPADLWPEAAWLCLPFNVDSPHFRLGRQGSMVDPVTDLVPGSNHNLYAIDTGVAILDDRGCGFGVCPLDSPLVSLGEPGGWRYDRRFVPTRAVLFVNLFNNQWTTNFRMWNEGTWTTRVRIWRIEGPFDAEYHLVCPALEARYPLQAVCVAGTGGRLPATAAGVQILRPSVGSAPDTAGQGRHNLLVTALGANPDGTGTLLRLWELAGKTESCVVNVPPGLAVRYAQPVDLRGRPRGAVLPIKDGQFRFDCSAFAPASFVLEP